MARETFIKMYRKMTEWGWYKDSNVKCVFLHLLLTANFKEKEWRGQKIKAGQVPIGRKALAKAIGLSEQQVRTALKKLESTGEISQKSTNKYTIVTIENWALYQSKDDIVTNEQPTSNQQITNNQPTSNHTIRKIRREEGKKVISIYKQIPPTEQQVRDYCTEKGYGIDVTAFMDFYDSKGWMVGKNKMKDWSAAVRNWERNDKLRANTQQGCKSQKDYFDMIDDWTVDSVEFEKRKKEAAENGPDGI